METRSEQSCGIIPVCRVAGERRFLLVQQTDGHWSFPKGHVEEGESFEAAAQRELFEECGIRPLYFFAEHYFDETYSFIHPVDGVSVLKHVRYFVGSIDPTCTVTVQPEEIIQFRYVSAREAHVLLAFTEARAVLAAVCDRGDSTGMF